jgi:uncharacterized protein (TIGR02646 family)
MVRTRAREACPDFLQANQAEWTARWRQIVENHAHDDWATPKAKELLREAVVPLTHGKCAYCEGHLGAQSWIGVEHHHPKRAYPDQAFEWANLLPVCDICNSMKGNQDHRGALLKPDEEDPERFFSIHPDTGELEAAPGLSDEDTRRAEQTIRICDLKRSALCEERAELIEALSLCILRADAGSLESYLKPRTEYKLVVRKVFESKGRADLAAEDRRRYQE